MPHRSLIVSRYYLNDPPTNHINLFYIIDHTTELYVGILLERKSTKSHHTCRKDNPTTNEIIKCVGLVGT